MILMSPQALQRYARHGTRQYLDLGGDAPEADPFIGKAAKLNAETGEKALKFYIEAYNNDIKPRQDRNDALTAKVTNQQLADQQAASRFAGLQRDEYTRTYLPNERQVAADAAGYDSGQNIQERQGIASASVLQSFATARQQAVQALAKYGINPNSGAFAAINGRLSTQQALADSGARTGAAFDTKDKGIALRAGVVNTGRGLTNTSAQFFASSNSAGSGAAGASGSNVQAGNQSVGTGGSGYGLAMQGYTNAAGALNQQYSTQVQAAGQNPLLETIGAGVGLYAGLK